MAKQSGLGLTTFQVADAAGTARDIRNDIGDFQISTPRAVQDVTGLDSSANERILLLADYSLSVSAFFNVSANRAHDVFKTVPSTSVGRLVTMTMGGVTMAATLLFTDYNLTRAAGGAVTAKCPGVLSNGAVPTWA